MPLKLVPRKLACLGARLGIGDVARAAEDGPVEGEDFCPLDELGSGKSKCVSHGLRSQLSWHWCSAGRLTWSRLSAGPRRDFRPVAYVRRDRHGAAMARINHGW
jgi:hypothetical protein